MIGFTGLSHLGIVSSIAAASKGFDVVAHDPNPTLCADLTAGRLPYFEPDLAELLEKARPHIRFTSDIRELKSCNLIYFSQDVPTDKDNRSDLSSFPKRIDEVDRIAASESTLVILSQVPPGFTRRMAARRRLTVCYQVETLIFGRAVERALYPERYIVGCEDPSKPLPEAFDNLLKAYGCPILPMKYESAELAKISINFCLVASVSVANTLAEVCEAIGADWSEIVPALKLDKRIGPHSYLSPGLGIAGGNLERDLLTVHNLADEYGTDARLIDAYLSGSRHCRDWVLRKIHSNTATIKGTPTIAVWGLAYKQDTKSTKNSPSLALIDALGSAFHLRAYDPQVSLDAGSYPHVFAAKSAVEACRGADILAVMTPWSEFASVDLNEIASVMRGRLLLDPYALLAGRVGQDKGFTYYRIGTSTSPRRNVA